MKLKIGINGFGRIGRSVFRAAAARSDIEIVAINDLAEPGILAHLLKYDSVHGAFRGCVTSDARSIGVNGQETRVLKEEDPGKLPWGRLGVDLVIESTGRYTSRAGAARHLSGGARKVVISAPADDADLTVCMGVNQEKYDPSQHHVISNASCTTNCLAPVAKVLLERFGIVRGTMTTVHPYTNGQPILDLPHQDLRRARAGGLSMIPTTTGAMKAVALVLPQLHGRLEGLSIRVPTPNVSIIDLVVQTERKTTVEEVNAAMREAADGRLGGILEYCDEPLVSSDFNGNPASSIFDPQLTSVINGDMVKVFSWYDNECGYANRLVDLVRYLSGQS